MRSVFAACAVATTLAIAGLSAASVQAEIRAETPARTITVTGQGEVRVDPDMATVVIGVQSNAEEAAQALDEASAATAAILARLDVEGVDPDDIRSGAIRLTPQYSQSVISSGRQIVGYQAVNSVEVEVKDLADLGSLLAALVGDGANRLDSVRFGLQDPTAATDDARRLAVADAQRRAALYADAAGVPLGDLLTLSEAGGGGYRALHAEPVMMEMAVSSPQFDVPVAPGKIDLSASVALVFAIAE